MYYPSDDDAQWSDYHTCLWCGEPSDTSICPACQQRYACEHDALPAELPAPSLVEVVREVTQRKKHGRV